MYARLMHEAGFSQVVLINVPINSGVAVVVRKVEHDFPGRAVKLAWQRNPAAAFRINEFHFLGICIFLGRIGIVFRMLLAVEPLHSGRQLESALSVNSSVIWAGLSVKAGCGNVKSVNVNAIRPGKKTGLVADFGAIEVYIRGCKVIQRGEPGRAVCGENVENLEHHGAGGAGSEEPRGANAGGVARPHSDREGRSRTDCPGIPVPIAGAGFPRHLLDRPDDVPVDLIRPAYLLQSIKSIEQRHRVILRLPRSSKHCSRPGFSALLPSLIPFFRLAVSQLSTAGTQFFAV